MTEVEMKRKYIRSENKKYPENAFVEIPRSEWRDQSYNATKVFRSKHFLVQVFVDPDLTRLSICRTSINKKGEWVEGIDWEDLMMIKRGVGYGNSDAVEAFPKDCDTVNVANMRHLWIVPAEFTKFFWRCGK